MVMHAFDYVEAQSVTDAVDLLREHPGARLLAGGMSLLPLMKQHRARPPCLISLERIDALRGVTRSADELVLGALASHAQVASSPDACSSIPALARLAGAIGDPQVRHRGTLGGAIASNDPVADYPAALVALGATVETDRRVLPAAAFFTGPFRTALGDDEIVVRIRFPLPSAAAYEKFLNPASGYALVGVFVARHRDATVRVAVIGAGEHVFRMPAMEAALAQSFAPASVTGEIPDEVRLIDDVHGSAAYRAQLIEVMARRAVTTATTGDLNG